MPNLLKKTLPSWAYNRLIGNWNRDGLRKYLHNTNWLFGARFATFVTSFLTMAIVARYLGPENLGKLSYAQSFVSILSVIASLGLDQILYRDLTKYPDKENRILGTAIVSKFIFGILAFIIAIGLSIFLGNEKILTLLIGITAFTFLINPLGTIGILFQSRVEAKYSSQITIFLAFFIPALKLLIIFFGKGIIYFALILLLEALISVIWSIYIYTAKLHLSLSNWQFDKTVFIQLLKDAWPFLFSGLFAYLYARIDQVMLQHYLGSTEVGLYDSAVKISNLWSFLPALIITSLFPALVNAKQTDRSEYLRRFRSLTILVMLVTLTYTLITFLLAKPLVLLIFGNSFIGSIAPLQIYIWSGAIAVLGLLVQNYLTAENRGDIYFVLTLVGAVLNIVLNLFMIPSYGMIGAAIATIFSYAVIPLGIFFYKQTRIDTLSLIKGVV